MKTAADRQIEAVLREHFRGAQFEAVIVPDEVEIIAAALLRFTDDLHAIWW
jgi:hypothetical protein